MSITPLPGDAAIVPRRLAHVWDAPVVAALYAQAWPLSVQHAASAAVQAALLESRGPEFWADRISDPDAVFVLGYDGLDPVGFTGWTVTEDDAELACLFIHPSALGSGVAGALHDNALIVLHGRHPEPHLWVADGNARAEAFYTRRGWNLTDQTKEHTTSAGGYLLRRWINPRPQP